MNLFKIKWDEIDGINCLTNLSMSEILYQERQVNSGFFETQVHLI